MSEFGSLNISWYATTITGATDITKMILSGNEFRVLFYLLSKVDVNNRVKLPKYQDIANDLGTSLPTIKKAMMNLRINKLIVKDTNFSKTIFLNPTFFYTGNYRAIDEKQEYFDDLCNTKKDTTDTEDEK